MSLTDLFKTPLSVKQFIELALYHPEYGYYMKQPVFGAIGDYTTAPEMTQIFGELVAVWCLNYLENLPIKSTSITLIELGPGRGTLMADMLRVFQKFPAFYKGLKVYLIEISPALQQIQKHTLKDHPVEWVSKIKDVPVTDVTFIIANEFFDALPIEQYIYLQGEWQKRRIGWVESKLDFLGPKDIPIRQECPDYIIFMDAINGRLETSKGAAILIDYGDDNGVNHGQGDTLQALHKHRYASPFENIGQQDLSHAVDFTTLKQLVSPDLKTHFTTQADFLLSLGLEQRLINLCQNASPYEVINLRTAAARLISGREMGQLFKVLTIESS